METLLSDGFIRHASVEGGDEWRETCAQKSGSNPREAFWGKNHFVGFIYGVINLVVCVPTLVSYTHIVFTGTQFESVMPELVKLYFLSSAIIQGVLTLYSTIAFSIGQVQDVGLIFLAGMVRNVVEWSREQISERGEVLKPALPLSEVVATSLWQCATSTFVVGLAMICIGRLKLGEYVKMLPLPVVGGYLSYIGFFCLAAGLSIGLGRPVSGPQSMLEALQDSQSARVWQLVFMTAAMLFAHFRVKHFLGMPAVLLLLPLLFFAATAALGYSVEECRVAGWLPAAPAARSIPVSGESGLAQRIFVDLDLERFVQILDPRAVHWHFLPRQFISVVGLIILVTFGSSLDIAAIQAELGGQKLDYNGELEAIGIANLVSGLAGGATGSYIFSQTIFSAKRGVQSRWNGIVVFVGEFSLFLVPLDVLQFLPTSYIGGTMCLFGIDIMKDWLVSSRHLMSRLEYLILWFTFVITMCLTSVETFGVIEGIAFGSVASSFAFAINYAQTSDVREFVSATSSVVRPWKERQVLSSLQNSILAVSLHSFAFFGASMHMTKGIESQAEEQGARFVCLDFGRLSGIDATAADQIRMLVVQLEQGGRQVLLSSLRSSTVRRLLAAHSVVIPGSISRPVFQSLDQSLKWCEAKLLERWLPSNPLSISNIERPLTELLLQYVEGFGHSTGADGRPSPSSNDVAAARALVPHFDRLELNVGDYLFRQQDPADALFIVAAGGLRLTCPANYEKSHGTSRAQVAWVDTGHSRERSPSDASEHEEAIGVGAIVGDTAFFACHSCGLDAFAASGGCTVFRISRRRLEELELSNPSAVVLLQKVILRDLTQLQVQHLGPIQACSRLK